MSLSGDGTTFVGGAPLNDRNGIFSGQTRLYSFDATIDDYPQVGSDIYGESAWDLFGRSVSISADGTTFMVGAPYHSGIGGDRSGRVLVYYFNSSTNSYTQIGSEINGTESGGWFGSSVSISGDGQTLVVGAPGSKGGNGTLSGLVRVYKFNITANEYTQIGSDIISTSAYYFIGYSVSISDDGTTVVVGARHASSVALGSGLVRVYSFNSASSSYVQIGKDIYGEAENDLFGDSVSISANGTLFVVGARFNDGNGPSAGHVRVYHFNEAINQYEQFGPDIDGARDNDFFGASVSISADGTSFAVGATGYNLFNNSFSGHVLIYNISESTNNYAQLIADIFEPDDLFGSSVSISSNGTILLVGAPGKLGRARIYRKTTRMTEPTKTPTFVPARNPTRPPTITPIFASTKTPTRTPTNIPLPITSHNRCGIFGLNLFCPRRGNCGFFRRLFNIGNC